MADLLGYSDIFEYRQKYCNKKVYVIISPGRLEEAIVHDVTYGYSSFSRYELVCLHVKDNHKANYVLGKRAFVSLVEAELALNEYLIKRSKEQNVYQNLQKEYKFEVSTIVCHSCDKPISPLGRCGCN